MVQSMKLTRPACLHHIGRVKTTEHGSGYHVSALSYEAVRKTILELRKLCGVVAVRVHCLEFGVLRDVQCRVESSECVEPPADDQL